MPNLKSALAKALEGKPPVKLTKKPKEVEVSGIELLKACGVDVSDLEEKKP